MLYQVLLLYQDNFLKLTTNNGKMIYINYY